MANIITSILGQFEKLFDWLQQNATPYPLIHQADADTSDPNKASWLNPMYRLWARIAPWLWIAGYYTVPLVILALCVGMLATVIHAQAVVTGFAVSWTWSLITAAASAVTSFLGKYYFNPAIQRAAFRVKPVNRVEDQTRMVTIMTPEGEQKEIALDLAELFQYTMKSVLTFERDKGLLSESEYKSYMAACTPAVYTFGSDHAKFNVVSGTTPGTIELHLGTGMISAHIQHSHGKHLSIHGLTALMMNKVLEVRIKQREGLLLWTAVRELVDFIANCVPAPVNFLKKTGMTSEVKLGQSNDTGSSVLMSVAKEVLGLFLVPLQLPLIALARGYMRNVSYQAAEQMVEIGMADEFIKGACALGGSELSSETKYELLSFALASIEGVDERIALASRPSYKMKGANFFEDVERKANNLIEKMVRLAYELCAETPPGNFVKKFMRSLLIKYLRDPVNRVLEKLGVGVKRMQEESSEAFTQRMKEALESSVVNQGDCVALGLTGYVPEEMKAVDVVYALYRQENSRQSHEGVSYLPSILAEERKAKRAGYEYNGHDHGHDHHHHQPTGVRAAG